MTNKKYGPHQHNWCDHSFLKVLLHTMAHHSRLRPHSTICILFPPFCLLHSHCYHHTHIFIYKDEISQNYMRILLEPSRDYECTKSCGNKIIWISITCYMSPQDWFAKTNCQCLKYERLRTKYQNSKTLHLTRRIKKIYICICYEIIVMHFNHFCMLLSVFIT